MQIVDSTEVRWFFTSEDARVPLLRAWFRLVDYQAQRTDYYFPTRSRELGIKARLEAGTAPKFEVKHRSESLGLVQFSSSISGAVEHWSKLSLEIAHETPDAFEAWTKIEKARRLRRFSVLDDVIEEVATEERLAVGCGVELTRLQLNRSGVEQPFWTFGFEVFGPTGIQLEVLLAVCRTVFAEQPKLILDAGTSKSYPEWLSEVLNR